MAAITPDEVPFWPWGLLLFIAGLYVVGVAALIAAGRREDARALAGFIPDCVVLVYAAGPGSGESHALAAPSSSLSSVTSPCRSTWSPTSCPASASSTTRSCSASPCASWFAAAAIELVREAWPGPQASLTLVLRAAGLETNGVSRQGSRQRDTPYGAATRRLRFSR